MRLLEHLSEGVGTVVAGALAALAAYLGGVRSGKAQFITAASTAADLMLNQQSGVIQRMEGVIQRQAGEISALKERDAQCQSDLAEVREQLVELRVAAGLPPWEPRPLVEAEEG